jgi:hypothetical protein
MKRLEYAYKLAICYLALALAGCAHCELPENRNKFGCQALRVVTDCGAPEVAKIVIDIVASVGAAFASQDYEHLIGAIVADLRHRGLTDAWSLITCAIGQFRAKGGLRADHAWNAHAEAWMAAHPVSVK